MSVPLATLQRHGQLVWLHDPFGLQAAATAGSPSKDKSNAVTAAASIDPARGTRLTFWRRDDARSWLWHWKADSASVMALRHALLRREPSAPVSSWSDEQVLSELAAQLARGAVVATESLRPKAPAVLPAAPVAPAVVEPPAVPVAQLLAPLSTPAPLLLPVLEEVQMEGAEVLPEIEQSLEQVELTIGEIKVAPVSLAPAPSKVPAIETAMTEAAASVTTTLDNL